MATVKNMFLISVFLFLSRGINSEEEPIYMCDSQIYCQGPILEAVNSVDLLEDTKSYVDMPLKQSPSDTLAEFDRRFGSSKNISASELGKFLEEYFYSPGRELFSCTPSDWKESPDTFNIIKDKEYRQWAYDLNKIWLTLCRRINESMMVDFDRTSMLYVPNCFIAPGGRFQSYYYWDSYWVVKGLLWSQMYDMAKGIIENFAYLINDMGFIPNGGRVYYSQRSQPPFFIPMVYEYFTETNDKAFLKQMLPIMEKELEWWKTNRTVQITQNGTEYTVYQYRTRSNTPRPEMWKIDVELANEVPREKRPALYRDIASAAETGIDFSSREFADPQKMSTIKTTDMLQVDLNAILCWNMDIMRLSYSQTGDHRTAKKYLDKREEMTVMVDEIFYNQTLGSWFDYDYKKEQHRAEWYPSNAAPLFTDCYDLLDSEKPKRFYQYMKDVGALSYPNGIPSSLVESGQQWDMPNSWPPQNHMIIEGFRKSEHQEMQEHAFQIAESWLKVNYLVYKKTGFMYEKYNVTDTTYQPGGGGEYEVQPGFGWTNGVALDLLRTYGSRLVAPESAPTKPKFANHILPSMHLLIACAVIILISMKIHF